MSEFKDRIIKLLNDGKNISVELPNDIFIKDLLVELEDNKSHVVEIIDSSMYNSYLSGYGSELKPFSKEFRYFKMESIKCPNYISGNEFIIPTRLSTKEMECRIFCKPKLLRLKPLNNKPVNTEILDTIKDYLGLDMLAFEDYQTRSGKLVHIVYNSYEVDEREV